MATLRYINHPQAERFDEVTVRTIERWKDSELSGSEWRFSYIAEFKLHGQVVAEVGGASVQDCLLQAAAQFNRVESDVEHLANLRSIFCCQPACTEPWVVLKHPVRKFDEQGTELIRGYPAEEVRGFCVKHAKRGDCGLDDADDNYLIIDG